MEIHSTWIQELTKLGLSYNYEKVVSGAKLDLKSSTDMDAFMASLLLAYTMTEPGQFEDSSLYLEGAYKIVKKVDDEDTRSGCEYLCNSLGHYLESRSGTSGPSQLSTVLPAFEALSDQGRAVVYACKGYALSRWDPISFCISIVESFDRSVQLDPRTCYYRIGQAVALGRQRRQLASTGRLSSQESVKKIEHEIQIWKHCVSHGDADEKLLAKSFMAFVASEIIVYHFEGFTQSEIRKRQENMVTVLDEIYQSLKAGTVKYNKFTIAKRAAMSYTRGSKVKAFERHFLSRAEELFKIAIDIAKEWSTSGYLDPYHHVSLEYGKLLNKQKQYLEAQKVFFSGWTRYRIGEHLIQYITSCKHANEHYIPLFDIEDGLSKMPANVDNRKYKVALLCLKGDYVRHIGRSFSDIVSPWMEALRVDPEGQYMKGVLRSWGTWKKGSNIKWGDPTDLFIDYVQVLEGHLQRHVKDACDNSDELQHTCGLIKLAEYFTTKLPRDQLKARGALEEALQYAQKMGDHRTSSRIRKEIDSLTAVIEDVSQGSNKLSDDLEKMHLCS